MERINLISLLFLASLILCSFFAAYLAQITLPIYVLAACIIFLLFVATFLNSEAALYILIFSMLLGPEFLIGGGAGGRAVAERGLTFRLDDFILTIIVFSWFAKTAVNKELGLFLKTPINIPIALYIFIAAIATNWGMLMGRVNFLNGFFFVLKYIEYVFVYFMVVDNLHTQKQARRLIFCTLLVCFLVSLYGISQIPTGQRVSAPFEGEIGEPNTFGGYLVFMIAVASGILLHIGEKKNYYKMALLVVLGTAFTAFVFTLSRTSYLAFIAMYLALLIFSKKRGLLIFLLFFIIISASTTPFIIPVSVKERIAFTYSQRRDPRQVQVGRVRLDTSASDRLKSWNRAMNDFGTKPILGFGVTGYRHFMDAQYPKILVETGLVGLATFFYLLHSIFKAAKQNLELTSNPLNKGIIVGFLSGFVGLVFHGFGANTFIIVRIMEPFWLVAGIVVLLPILERREQDVLELAAETEKQPA